MAKFIRPRPHFQEAEQGWIYILCITPAYKHAKHYIGWTLDVDQRVHEHLCGGSRSSPLIKAALAAGCQVKLTSFRRGTRSDERALKNRRQTHVFCPVCKEQFRTEKAAKMRLRRAIASAARRAAGRGDDA